MAQHYCKYYKQRKYVSYDNGITWQPLNEFRKGGLYEEDSSDCDYMTEYKWQLVDGYLCSGTTEYQKLQKYESVDGGISWFPSSPEEYQIGELVRENSNNCSLEKWVYTIEDGSIPTSYCSTTAQGGAFMEEGIAKSIQFTDGIVVCCGSSFNQGGCITDEARAMVNYGEPFGWKSLDIGYICGNVCYNSYLIEGKEVSGDCYCTCCCSPRKCACWEVTEFMPWLENADTMKIIYRQRYTRSSISSTTWTAVSGTKEYYSVGERWVRIISASTVTYDYFQHQLASVDEYGNITWTSEGSLIQYEHSTHLSNLEYIDELYNDGDSYIILNSVYGPEGTSMRYSARYASGTTPSGTVAKICSNSDTVDSYSTLECTHTLGNSCLNQTYSSYYLNGKDENGAFIPHVSVLFNTYRVNYAPLPSGSYYYLTYGTPSTNVYIQYVITYKDGMKIWKPARVVGTNIRGLLSDDYMTFLPLSKYEQDYNDYLESQTT